MTGQKQFLISVVAVVAASVGWLCLAGRGMPVTRPAAAAPTTRPHLSRGLVTAARLGEGASRSRKRRAAAGSAATKPDSEKYPPRKLISACRAKAAALAKRLDKSFKIVVRPPFVVAGDMSQRPLEACADRSVANPATAMWASYFNKKPDKVITALLFTGDKSYRAWAKKLFNDNDLPHFGYYRPSDRTLVMNISTGTGTLVHELTHALIHYDFAQVPDWFNEGLASLHEQCNVGPKKITGLTNWRLPALQAAIKAGKLRPLRDLVTTRDFYGPQQGLNYAQARYFCMYMQKLGLLQKFYKHFHKNHTGRGADVKAIEHIFEKKLPQIEKAYIAWVKTLRFR